MALANCLKKIFHVATIEKGNQDDSGSLPELKKCNTVPKNVKAAIVHWQKIKRKKPCKRATRSTESNSLFSAEY